MRYRGTALLALLLTVSLSGIARAGDEDSKQTFETTAQGATRVDRAGLAGLLWSLSASCDHGDELARRQCRAVRNARARRLGTQTFIVPGDASAFAVGAFDAKKKSLPLMVSGCIACIETISVDDQALYVLSKNKGATFQGAVARAAVTHETARPFADEDAALEWRTEVVPRLRTEFVVKLDASSTWKRDGKQGISVEILGFRVWDPCSGGIVCASPKSGKASVDKVACGGAVVEGEAADGGEGGAKGKGKGKASEPALPDELSARQIKETMKAVRASADACFEKFGVPGDAKLRVTVAGDGAVIAIEQTGDFQDTPTGTCIVNAVKTTVFPRTKKSRQSFSYPIVLR